MVQEILQYVRLTKQEVEKLQILLDDLHTAFNKVWRGCTVNGFGSIVSGLGIKTSDIDCYVQLPGWLSPPNASFVMKAKNILRRRHWIFQNLCAITSAKVPIVKFYHVPTARCCDLNFSSSAGVRNSQLISYLLNLDKRILPLSILIKYWSKIQNLTGVHLIPSYCLMLMVIFYLQQKNILPSIINLQLSHDKYIIDNWNTAFSRINHVNNNKETLYELLGGFFEYYNTFKYAKYIICPFVGKPVERDCFLKLDTVPAEFSIYKINVEKDSQCKPIRLDTPICVQDPFEHNRNCAVAVHPKLAQKIMTQFCRGDDIYKCNDDLSFLKTLLIRTDNYPGIKNKKKPAISNGIKKQYKINQNIRHSIKYITQNIFGKSNNKHKGTSDV
ncbi:terminal uridylyltransferase Tailor-like isoform X2 [Nymphalis io]|uniref:terminal uridylyltransferase Tailor-like isoform X2 n=1 Tax=Inachis io TaxID=171585 RepID=UPI002167845D|nr:terminal uridylyltransferase Tailor-like isoform X2 [Nymphalis io]